jgi:hypothetical protein
MKEKLRNKKRIEYKAWETMPIWDHIKQCPGPAPKASLPVLTESLAATEPFEKDQVRCMVDEAIASNVLERRGDIIEIKEDKQYRTIAIWEGR